MKLPRLIAAAASISLAFAGPASATTGSASAGSLSVTFTVNDVAFTGPECIEAPVQVDYSGSGSLELAASKEGSSNTISTYSYSPQAGTVTEGLQVCPYIDGAGTYFIRGSIEGDDANASLPEGLSFVVSTAPTKVSRLRARQPGRNLTIKGRVTALSDRGNIGVQTEVKLQGRLSKKAGGTGKWVTLGTVYPNEFGTFKFRGRTEQRLRGANIRAVVAPSAWAGAATASTRVKK